ncbi:MAG TPA: Xaa-Pro peptidase family protein [Thermohalobaculum sp.]|nr:Xaa-Pro peptidase family protein [Thermohalobaculum sp.]
MLHFTRDEFDNRMARTRAEMARRGLDVLLLFAPESQFWLTGYDTFGYCFFQCLIVSDGAPVLLTRSADLRQAQLTSTIKEIRIWKDRDGADPTKDLMALLVDMGLAGRRIGWETGTQGLTHLHGAKLAGRLEGLKDASDLMGVLRLVKSPAEIAYVKRAAELGDLAWDAAAARAHAGADEGAILGAMHDAIFSGGGDYPANEFIIGSGEHALLCRYQSGRRKLDAQDQLTLEWAGTYRHYHAANMKTIIIGEPRPQHLAMQAAARDALFACEAALQPGRPMADVFAAHAKVLDAAGLGAHRLNACGYSLGPRFSPSWMEAQMFYEGAPTVMAPGMVFFLHMILMDSDSGTAMTLGRTSVVTATGAEGLSRMPVEMVVG